MLAPDAPGDPEEDCAADAGDGFVAPAEVSAGGTEQADGDEADGVDEELASGLALAGDDGEHGDAGFGVVVAVLEGKRPEVGGRPHEDDQEENDGGPGQFAGHGGPADQGGDCAGCAADHDVLGGASLEQDCVDEHVEEDGGFGEEGGGKVDGERKLDAAEGGEQQAPGERLPGLQGTGGERALGGAVHDRVDVAVKPLIECVCAAGGEDAAEQGEQDEVESGPAVGGDDHRGDGGDEEEADDAGFGQVPERGGDREGSAAAGSCG